MLSRLLIITALLVHPGVVLAENFGAADWGMSPEAVRQAETRPNRTPIGVSDYLIYEASLPDIHRTRLVYQFQDGGLSTGRFLFEPEPDAAPAAWIEQFERIRSLIGQQYGEPVATEVLQADPTAELTPADWPGALSNDRLILKTRWRTDETILVQQLAWNQDGPHHQVIYRPVNSMADTSGSESTF